MVSVLHERLAATSLSLHLCSVLFAVQKWTILSSTLGAISVRAILDEEAEGVSPVPRSHFVREKTPASQVSGISRQPPHPFFANNETSVLNTALWTCFVSNQDELSSGVGVFESNGQKAFKIVLDKDALMTMFRSTSSSSTRLAIMHYATVHTRDLSLVANVRKSLELHHKLVHLNRVPCFGVRNCCFCFVLLCGKRAFVRSCILSPIGYFHSRLKSASLQLFESMSNDICNPEVMPLLQEYVAGSTYSKLRLRVERNMLKFIPFTCVDVFRGQNYSVSAASVVSHLKISLVNEVFCA